MTVAEVHSGVGRDRVMTASGRWIDPLALRPDDVVITDIAQGLAHRCRFGGACWPYYSVAEHSVRVARLLWDDGHDRETCAWGLMHDAAEAYLSDVPSPLKQRPDLVGYRAAEDRALTAIADALGLRGDDIPPAVVRADRALLATERRDLLPPSEPWPELAGVTPLPEVIRPWPPHVAYEAWLRLASCLAIRPWPRYYAP